MKNISMDKTVEFINNDETIQLELTNEFTTTIEMLEKTDKSLFITGKAGCGKSTLLNYFVDTTEKNVVVLAFTGLAAINVNGETIHSFFKFPLGFLDTTKIRKDKSLDKKLSCIDTIIIDEVSMVRADIIDGIDKSLREHKDGSKPFGGVQMIFIGDLYQLPPIVDKDTEEIYRKFYSTDYFFGGEVFKNYRLPYINLEKIYRQSDQKFIDMLNSIREMDSNLYNSIQLLNNNVVTNKKKIGNEMTNNDTIWLTTTNKKAKEVNDYFLNRIDGKLFKYTANIVGKFDKGSYPTDEVINLKVGTKVMFIRNDHNKRYVNGDVGIIKYLDDNVVVVRKNNFDIQLKKATWDKVKYKYVSNENNRGTVNKDIIGSFKQFPLKLAWSVTIHKSQGQTFNRALVDFHWGTFTSGQAYVALSRCRTLDGLMLKREMRMNDVKLDEEILLFYDMFKNINNL